MATVKQVAKSKTINLAAVIAILGSLQANSEQLQELLSPEAYGWAMVIIAAAFAAVRAVTDRALSEK